MGTQKPTMWPPGKMGLNRRKFVLGLLASGIYSPVQAGFLNLLATTKSVAEKAWMEGTEFDLAISETTVNLTGKPRPATLINQSLPAPVLRWREGDVVTLRVANHLRETSSIHWHGMILPSHMDGVPGISFQGIGPGETFTYRFPVQQSGTYWYHSHSGFQEQSGMYGAIVIDPLEPEPFDYDRDYVVMLSDWSDESPETIYATLKKLSHYYNINERTVGELWDEYRNKGLRRTWQERQMWNRMRMSERDLSDVSGYTYTFLMNGQPPVKGWTGLFQSGERVRLRFINGSAMTFFDVRIPDLPMTVVSADGQHIQPVDVEEFRIGVAETYDVIVEPAGNKAYTVFAQAIDRTGFARGTLTPDPRLSAEIPPMDSVPILTHGDMGMSHEGMAMSENTLSEKAWRQKAILQKPMSRMPMSGYGSSAMKHMEGMEDDEGMIGHEGDHRSGEQRSQRMQMAPGRVLGEQEQTGDGHGAHSKVSPKPNRSMPAMKEHSAHTMAPEPFAHDLSISHDQHQSVIKHKASEYGPHVDMRADNPQYRLSDPGVGLRNNGRRVLAYSDLKNLYPTADQRKPGREIELHLTGNMRRYMWSVDGVKFADAEPVYLKHNERVRFILVNDTMMNHPMHLHGMWSELETGDPGHLPRKHTVVVQPGAKISFLVTADALQAWAFHCHLLYHMPGMFRKVIVS